MCVCVCVCVWRGGEGPDRGLHTWAHLKDGAVFAVGPLWQVRQEDRVGFW